MATLINLRALVDILGGTATSRARFTATPSFAAAPAVRVQRDAVTFPATVRATFDGTSWDQQPALTVLPAGCYWAVRIYPAAGDALARDVQLPAGAGASIDFADLVDVDAHSAIPSSTQLSVWLTALDQKIAAQALVDAATYLPRWKANTAYLAAAIAVNPSGQIVRRKADGTSGATYDPNAWDIVAGGAAAAGVTQQATQTASFTAAAGNFYPVNASAGNVTVTLPAGSTSGQVIQLKKLDANAAAGAAAGIVLVTGKINGTSGATVPIRKQGMGKEYLADGSGGWTITLGDLDITQLGATATEQGFVMLAGDLGGTAAAPTVPGLATKADLVGGVVPTSQIPSLALNTVVPVASRSAMLSLTSAQVQPGDVAVDLSAPPSATRGSYMLLGADPSAIGNWVLLTAPTDVVSSVNGQTGTVVLGKADVGLSNVDNTADSAKPVSTAQQAALDGKAPTAAGLPLGGAAGFFLKKVSAADRDVTWADPNFADTFADVSLGAADGGAATQVVPQDAFTNLNWSTIAADPGSNWSLAQKRYTVPVDGIYLCLMRVRLQDSVNGGRQLGIGIHTAGVDGPWFQWNLSGSGTDPNRRLAYNYQRVARFTKDSPILGYVYAAGASATISIAGLQIIRLA